MACINKFGTSHSAKCDTLSKQIWKWAQEDENWLSVIKYSENTKHRGGPENEFIPRGNSGKIYLAA